MTTAPTTNPFGGFSKSVERVATRLGAADVTAGQIAIELAADHSEYGVTGIPAPSGPTGSRPIERWLTRVRELYDLDAVAQTPSRVVDGRLTILGLARLDPALDTALRTSGSTARLKHGLGFALAAVLHPWAVSPPSLEFAELWSLGPESVVNGCSFSPDGSLLATACDDRTVRVRNVATGEETWWVAGHDDEVIRVAWSPDGRLLASVSVDATARLWRAATAEQFAVLKGHIGPVWDCAFSPSENLLLTVGEDGSARLWDPGTGADHGLVEPPGRTPLYACVFVAPGRAILQRDDDAVLALALSDDGLLAIGGADRVRLRDEVRDVDWGELATNGSVVSCAFRPGTRLLVTAGLESGVRLWDTVSLTELALLRPPTGENTEIAFAPRGGLFAIAPGDGSLQLLEEVEPAAQLPGVTADVIGGADLVGIGADATALANVIAAKGTSPPLSIGLFGDWGAGKSFLIGEIQQRIRRIGMRSRGRQSAYCSHVRNIEFNAWHYADANLWASLVTHIFEELARPEPGGEVESGANLDRLRERLAARTGTKDRLVKAQKRKRTLEARRRLLLFTSGLAGAGEDDDALADLRDVRSATRLLLGSARAWAIGIAVTAVIAAVAVAVAIRGVSWVAAIASAALLWLGSVVAAVGWLRGLLRRAGDTARVVDVRATDEQKVTEAIEAERRAREEYEDFLSGQSLARFVTERSGTKGYGSERGLVSRIHDDFVLMSKLLTEQADGPEGDLPRIDRIVLYIDDLDRCPPKRVVEVLEAVHLILAVPLFVVVIAVDPRWLLRSLKQHYSDLLAIEGEDDAWQSTPLHYLEKIIQVPFALRPMGPGVESLVHGLLPVAVPVAEPVEPVAESSVGETATAEAPRTETPAPEPPPAPPEPRPSLSPPALALTEAERDFAVTVAAGGLRTPRTVEKFTNLYRLLRAGLDEDGLAALLAGDTGDLPEYRAVLILLATVIEFPEPACDFLTGLLEGDDADWHEYVQQQDEALASFLTRVTPEGTWTCEPFRRWALEVSRYSFATGQEVFARTVGASGTVR